MKKLGFILVLSIFTVCGISAQELALDEAIKRAALNIEEELPERASVLVLNIVSPSLAFTNYVLDELTDQLVMNRKLTVVDRQNFNAIRTEMNFQYSGEVSDESMVSIGKMLGAHYIVAGSLSERGENYRLRFRIIRTETSQILTSVIIDVKNSSQVAVLLSGSESNAKKANSKNSWVLGSVYGLIEPIMVEYPFVGFGIQYERMLSSSMSIGVNGYYTFLAENDNGNGIEAFVRTYPWKKSFFLGVALGYGSLSTEDYPDSETGIVRVTVSGFAVTPQFGWKIDAGSIGGLFVEIGAGITLLLGESTYETDFSFYLRWNIGLGYAF